MKKQSFLALFLISSIELISCSSNQPPTNINKSLIPKPILEESQIILFESGGDTILSSRFEESYFVINTTKGRQFTFSY